MSPVALDAFLDSIVRQELSEDPRDFFANYWLQKSHFALGTVAFVSFFLIAHGLVKLFLLAGMLREKLWAYPVAMILFSVFIVYQLYRLIHTYSFVFLLATLFDIIFVALMAHRYKHAVERSM